MAQAVLADPAGISESSITAVARKCQTSATTVLRFCRAIGLAGYPEMRTTFSAGAMSSRIAQFALVDCLFAGVAQRSYDQAIEALHSTN